MDELNREVEIERRKNERLQIEQRARKEELFAAVTSSTQKTQRHSDASEKDVLNSNSNKPEVILAAQLIIVSQFSDNSDR